MKNNKQKIIKYCEMTMEYWDFRANFPKCGKPAKYITPAGPITGRTMYVCGIHKRSVDAFHVRIGSKERCKKLNNERS